MIEFLACAWAPDVTVHSLVLCAAYERYLTINLCVRALLPSNGNLLMMMMAEARSDEATPLRRS